jgi:DNA-binding transcriptional LysR family regulator
VAEAVSFRTAAEKLHMSQPPLSKQIQLLEEELGANLFDRSKRRIALTPAGKVFLEHSRSILRSVEESKAIVARIARGQSGQLNLGLRDVSVDPVFAAILNVYAQRYRSVDLRIHFIAEAEQIAPNVRDGRVDFLYSVLESKTEFEGLEKMRVSEGVLSLIMASGHPLSRFRKVPLREAAAYPFMMYPRRIYPGWLDEINAIFNRHGCQLRIAQEREDVHSILAGVAGGEAVALEYSDTLPQNLPGLTVREITPAQKLPRNILYNPDKLSTIQSNFLTVIREVVHSSHLPNPIVQRFSDFERRNSDYAARPHEGKHPTQSRKALPFGKGNRMSLKSTKQRA